MRFELMRRGEALGEFTVRMPGIHNVLNALATIAVADELEVPMTRCKRGARDASAACSAASRSSARARTASPSSTTTAIIRPRSQATLEAAQRGVRAPHRRRVPAASLLAHARTASTSSRARSTAPTCVLLTDVYAAGEEPIEGATPSTAGRGDPRPRSSRRDVTCRSAATSSPSLRERLEPGDVVITLGAGDITKTGREAPRRPSRLTPSVGPILRAHRSFTDGRGASSQRATRRAGERIPPRARANRSAASRAAARPPQRPRVETRRAHVVVRPPRPPPRTTRSAETDASHARLPSPPRKTTRVSSPRSRG